MVTVYPSTASTRTDGPLTFAVVSPTDAPYTWDFSQNQSGGSLVPNDDGTEVTYYAGPLPGVDVIETTGSTVGNTGTATIQVLSLIQTVCDIIQTQMGSLAKVYVWDQKYNIPTDSGLYIAVGVASVKPFSNLPAYNPATSDFVQTVNCQMTLSIDIMSRSLAAVNLKERVVSAFVSAYAQQVCAANSMYLAPLPTRFNNLSQIDGMAIPYRFQLLVNAQYVVTIQNPVDYYDTFQDWTTDPDSQVTVEE